jgi:hypothetical protein
LIILCGEYSALALSGLGGSLYVCNLVNKLEPKGSFLANTVKVYLKSVSVDADPEL